MLKKALCLTIVTLLTNTQINPAKAGKKYIFPLTSTNFNLSTNHGKTNSWLILFQSPNCGHCKTFKPLFSKLAFDNKNSNTKFGSVNCREEKDVCKMNRVKAYPTLFFMKDSKMYQFKGRRAEDRINRFILDGYKEIESSPIYDRLPTFLEEMSEGFKQFRTEVELVFRSEGNYVAKGVLGVFFVMLVSIIFLSGYFVYDCVKGTPVVRKREEKIKRD